MEIIDRDNPTSQRSQIVIILLPIMIFLLSETLRKYVFVAPFVLVTLDICITALFLKFCSLHAKRKAFLVLAGFCIHGLIFSVIYDQSALVLMAGIRELIPIIFGFYLGLLIFNDRACYFGFIVIVLICLMLTILAIAQIIVTPIHFLNVVGSGIELGRSKGLGSYDPRVQELFGIGLFRPAAIFVTTGKLGTTIAALTLITITLLLTRLKKIPIWLFLISSIIVLGANIIAMQRAFLYPLLLYLGIIFLITPRVTNFAFLLLIAMTLIVNIQILSDGKFISPNYIPDFLIRLFEFPAEFIARVMNLGDLQSMFDGRPIFGYGFGFFSNYSSLLGGRFYSDFFDGEGGWHQITANFGFLGLGLFVLLSSLIVVGLVANMIKAKRKKRLVYFHLTFLSLLLLVWGITHNVYGSSFFMFSYFFAIGISVRELHHQKINTPNQI